jgi:hypothetical protein
MDVVVEEVRGRREREKKLRDGQTYPPAESRPTELPDCDRVQAEKKGKS